MKGKFVKKLIAGTLAAVMVLGGIAGCGDAKDADQGKTDSVDHADQVDKEAGNAGQEADAEENKPAAGGTIMWLSNISSGPSYEGITKLGEMICAELGYKFTVVYGDAFNDPAGNLNAVKNGMTNDVVGLVVTQDGGVQNIMEEYPELYVCGFNSDMASVYDEEGASHAVLENDKWLGTMVDGYADGAKLGQEYFDVVVEKGYKKVSLITFPVYAYPQHTVAANTFIAAAEEYNAKAAEEDKIEIVGETKVLEFSPLDESYFLEGDNGELDAIVAFCAGVQFVYPTMKSAITSGTCSADTKLITGGFEDDSEILADIGGEGVIQWLGFSPSENIYMPMILIDNALNGTQYADLDTSVPVDSIKYILDSVEDVENVMNKGFTGSRDLANLQMTWEDAKNLLTRYNPDASYADLVAAMHSDQLLTDALMEK